MDQPSPAYGASYGMTRVRAIRNRRPCPQHSARHQNAAHVLATVCSHLSGSGNRASGGWGVLWATGHLSDDKLTREKFHYCVSNPPSERNGRWINRRWSGSTRRRALMAVSAPSCPGSATAPCCSCCTSCRSWKTRPRAGAARRPFCPDPPPSTGTPVSSQ